MLELALDQYAKGHSIALVGQFRPAAVAQMGKVHQEVSLINLNTGKRLIICGLSKIGGGDVCGS
jgi:hypothetical protein